MQHPDQLPVRLPPGARQGEAAPRTPPWGPSFRSQAPLVPPAPWSPSPSWPWAGAQHPPGRRPEAGPSHSSVPRESGHSPCFLQAAQIKTTGCPKFQMHPNSWYGAGLASGEAPWPPSVRCPTAPGPTRCTHRGTRGNEVPQEAQGPEPRLPGRRAPARPGPPRAGPWGHEPQGTRVGPPHSSKASLPPCQCCQLEQKTHPQVAMWSGPGARPSADGLRPCSDLPAPG